MSNALDINQWCTMGKVVTWSPPKRSIQAEHTGFALNIPNGLQCFNIVSLAEQIS